jgi:hypothetical protein
MLTKTTFTTLGLLLLKVVCKCIENPTKFSIHTANVLIKFAEIISSILYAILILYLITKIKNYDEESLY